MSVLAMWIGTYFGVGVTSRMLYVSLPLCMGENYRLTLFPGFSCSHCPASTSCLVTPPIFPALFLTNQHFIKQVQGTNLYRVKPLSHSTLGAGPACKAPGTSITIA